jgi:hypothetical protein
MPKSRKHTVLFAAALAVTALGCGAKEQAPSSAADALADAAAAKSLPVEHYVSPTEKFDLTLPGAWTGRYRATERKDTTAGARLAIDFKFVPDSGSKAPSLTAVVVRIIPRKAWDANAAKGARPPGAKIGEIGDDVYVLALPESNPYPTNSPEAPIYDRLIISIAQGGQQIHVTARP